MAATPMACRPTTRIVCLVGVEVQRTSMAGLELVEFEFLPDAA
jgi:hypothetical protein